MVQSWISKCCRVRTCPFFPTFGSFSLMTVLNEGLHHLDFIGGEEPITDVHAISLLPLQLPVVSRYLEWTPDTPLLLRLSQSLRHSLSHLHLLAAHTPSESYIEHRIPLVEAIGPNHETLTLDSFQSISIHLLQHCTRLKKLSAIGFDATVWTRLF